MAGSNFHRTVRNLPYRYAALKLEQETFYALASESAADRARREVAEAQQRAAIDDMVALARREKEERAELEMKVVRSRHVVSSK